MKFLIIALIYLAASSFAQDQGITTHNSNESTSTTIPGATSISGSSETGSTPASSSSGTEMVPKTPATSATPSASGNSTPKSPTSEATSTTEKPSSASATTTKAPVTNAQSPRAPTDCSSKFQEVVTSSAFSPERIILGQSGSPTAGDFCKSQKKSAEELNTVCSKSTVDADKATAAASAGILAMVTSVCADTASLKILSDEKCVAAVKQATTECSVKANVVETSVVYPSDLIIFLMKEANTNVCNALKDSKGCISSGLEKSACKVDQLKTLLTPLDSLISASCPSTDSPTTTPSAQTTTTASPAAPTTKAGRSSASSFQTSILIAMLPAILLFFSL